MTVSKIRLPDNTEHDIRAKYLIQSTSSDAVSAEFSARTVTEDAIANIQKIYGNTVKWNQLLTTTHYTIQYSGSVRYELLPGTFSLTQGHYYYVACVGTGIYSNTTVRFNDTTNSYTSSYVQQKGIIQSTITSNNTTQVQFSKDSNVDAYFRLHDLTAIYGSGNEPTVSEFEAQYPAAYYPYSPLTLLSNSATAIQSKDSSNNVIGNCDLNIPTLTGKLNGVGSSVVIFLDGMKRAGSTCDELTVGKAVKRCRMIDLGSLSWIMSTGTGTNAVFFTTQLSNATEFLAAPYTFVDINVTSNSAAADNLTDKTMTYRHGTNDRIYIKDMSYSSAADFKAAMSGVYLCYNLATPEEYILDNAIQLQYPVVAGGTEMVLPTTGTAPIKMDVIYGNAADAAATMSQNYISVDSMKEFLAALGTQMGGTWSMGYENGKHTFIFTSN